MHLRGQGRALSAGTPTAGRAVARSPSVRSTHGCGSTPASQWDSSARSTGSGELSPRKHSSSCDASTGSGSRERISSSCEDALLVIHSSNSSATKLPSKGVTSRSWGRRGGRCARRCLQPRPPPARPSPQPVLGLRHGMGAQFHFLIAGPPATASRLRSGHAHARATGARRALGARLAGGHSATFRPGVRAVCDWWGV